MASHKVNAPIYFKFLICRNERHLFLTCLTINFTREPTNKGVPPCRLSFLSRHRKKTVTCKVYRVRNLSSKPPFVSITITNKILQFTKKLHSFSGKVVVQDAYLVDESGTHPCLSIELNISLASSLFPFISLPQSTACKVLFGFKPILSIVLSNSSAIFTFLILTKTLNNRIVPVSLHLRKQLHWSTSISSWTRGANQDISSRQSGETWGKPNQGS